MGKHMKRIRTFLAAGMVACGLVATSAWAQDNKLPELASGATKSALAQEALKKDPVCGTFVAPSTAVQKEKDGQTYFFCSPTCRDKF